MRSFIIILLSIFSTILFAQTDSIPKSNWSTSAITGLNISQIALSNWTQGGDNSLAWTFFSKVDVLYSSNVWAVKNNLKLAFGRTKLGSADFRTNDNEIYLESVLTYDIKWVVNPYFSNTVRTVIGKGYNYTQTPAVQTAKFFDPGYITQSLGFSYSKDNVFSSRLGVALQETFADQFAHLYVDDPKTLDKIERFKLETGIESVTEGSYSFAENMLASSKLRLFSRFNSLDVWDVRWDNTITAQINKYFNTNLNVLLIYEKSQSLKTQVKEALQFGVTYTIL
ncbi:MAG: DUF3078 domain-containing protein [Bacteroidota bacterium]|nr:DUF3078 domain-containing protein [Bacteroidota bacterium]